MDSSPEGSLTGRSALVTGASSGIGFAVARRLAAAGATLVLNARRPGALETAAVGLRAYGVPADVSEPGGVDRLAEEARRLLNGAPDIVVSAAGAFELAPLSEMSVESFERQIGVNLRAPFLLIRTFLPEMLERGSGHVVTIGSVAGRAAFAENGAYSASKFGVRGLHAVLDAELRGTGVRATLVEPAATDTPLWDAVDRRRHPGLPTADRMLPADAVADAVLFALTRPPAVDVRNILLDRS